MHRQHRRHALGHAALLGVSREPAWFQQGLAEVVPPCPSSPPYPSQIEGVAAALLRLNQQDALLQAAAAASSAR